MEEQLQRMLIPLEAKLLANCFKFVEYDQRAHRLNTLVSFSFWVSSKAPFQR